MFSQVDAGEVVDSSEDEWAWSKEGYAERTADEVLILRVFIN